ncbi:Homeodomain-like protein [Xylariaceae sp. FL0016]|nr:Homeodomain-like protein [Xylariaceae sp. FL0016]
MASQRRGPWAQREDSLLMHLVQTQGALNWVRISQQLTSRTPKQCRERYHQNLKPTLNHDPITAEEGAMIERLVEQIGKRWAEIARRLHNRSDNAVKNWWNGSMNRRKRMSRRKGHHSAGPYDQDLDLDHHAHIGHGHGMQYHQHQRIPAPLRLATVPPPYPTHYAPYATASPTATRYAHQPTWTGHSSLPSPSTTSPGADSLDGAPSLISDSSSMYSTSPTTAGPGPALPPLRYGDEASPRSAVFDPSQQLPPLSQAHEQLRLPPILDRCVEYREGDRARDRYQLPTAPNSPLELAPELKATMSPRGPVERERQKGKENEKMAINHLIA